MVNRLPMEIDVVWFESKPRIDFKMPGTSRGTQSFRGEDTAELLRSLAHAHAHLLVAHHNLCNENKSLRQSLGKLKQ